MRTRITPPPARARGFSLLETMIVVAILGVIASLAVPNLLPLLRAEGLRAAGAAINGFVAQARISAMTERRCVRIRVDSTTGPGVLVSEKLNAFDCENPSSPVIVSTQPLWIETSRMALDQESQVLALVTAPSDTATEIRFRPSGRIFSADDDLSDDDALLSVTQPGLAAPANIVRVVVDAAGPICTLPVGKAATGTGNNLVCP